MWTTAKQKWGLRNDGSVEKRENIFIRADILALLERTRSVKIIRRLASEHSVCSARWECWVDSA